MYEELPMKEFRVARYATALCVSVAAMASTAITGTVWAGDTIPAYVSAAVSDVGRPPLEIARDKNRKPAEKIAFAGIKPGDVVVDFVPGDGYYTRLLSKTVGPKGKVYDMVPLAAGLRDVEEERRLEQEYIKRGKQAPFRTADPVLALQNIAEYSNLTVIWLNINQYGGQFSLPEQVDAVWISDSYHDLHDNVYKVPDMLSINRSVMRSIKPGGTYVIDDYTAPEVTISQGISLVASGSEGVKGQVVSAGFQFDGETKIPASNNDPKASAADKSEHFVLRFKKPLTVIGDRRAHIDPFTHYYGNTYIYNFNAVGAVSGDRPRWHYYHRDGTYQEFGTQDMQSGRDYWDADGRNCQLHEFPAEQRGWTVCHALPPLQVGEQRLQENSVGDGPKWVTLIPGQSALATPPALKQQP